MALTAQIVSTFASVDAADVTRAAGSPSVCLQVRLPLDVGTQVECRFRDGQYRLAKVIERRPRKDVDTGEYEYYVHYDKRALLSREGRVRQFRQLSTSPGLLFWSRTWPCSFSARSCTM